MCSYSWLISIVWLNLINEPFSVINSALSEIKRPWYTNNSSTTTNKNNINNSNNKNKKEEDVMVRQSIIRDKIPFYVSCIIHKCMGSSVWIMPLLNELHHADF